MKKGNWKNKKKKKKKKFNILFIKLIIIIK
jgi:hypothetical protein